MNITTKLKDIFQWKNRAKIRRQYLLLSIIEPRVYRWFEDYYSSFNLILPTDIVKSAQSRTDMVLQRLVDQNKLEKYQNKLPLKEMIKCL